MAGCALFAYNTSRENKIYAPMLSASSENTADNKGVSFLAFDDPRVVWESTGTGLQYVLIDFGVSRKADCVYIGNIPVGTTALTLKAGSTSATTDNSQAITIYQNDGFEFLTAGGPAPWFYRYYRVEITNGGVSSIGNISLFQNLSSRELFDGDPAKKILYGIGPSPRVEVRKYGSFSTNGLTGQEYQVVGGVRLIETNTLVEMDADQRNLLDEISLSDNVVFVPDATAITPIYGVVSFDATQIPGQAVGAERWSGNYDFTSLSISPVEGKL